METTKITTKKKIGMANPLVQKIGNFKKWNIGNCIMQRHWAIGDWRKLVGTIEVTILSKITLIWLISWKINLPFFKSTKVKKLFSFFILKYFTNFVKLVDFFPAKKGCLKRRSQEKVSGVDHRRGSLLGSLLEVSGEVSRGGLRGRSQGEVSGGGLFWRSLSEVSGGGLEEVSGGGLWKCLKAQLWISLGEGNFK